MCQQHRLFISVFHVLIPSLFKQKAKILPKPLPTSRSLQTPAINRPLIGGCNRIQFISRSDGLTFIITRGSTCHELWAIHSLVEINCITSAQYHVLRTQYTGVQLLPGCWDQPPPEPLFGEPQPGGWAGAATAWGHFGSCCARVVSRGCCPHCPCHQAGTSPSITALHSHHPPHVLFRTSSASSMDPSFRRKCRAWWGLGGASWALLLLALALTLIRGARLLSEQQQQLQVPALLTPPLGPPTGNEIRNHEKRGHSINQVWLRSI